MTAPLGLDAGLHLERAQLLLPWGSSIEDLCRIGNPEIYRHSSATNVSWKNETALGGLPVQIDAMSAAGVNVFYLCGIERAESAEAEYEGLLHELSLRLGSPHSSVIDSGYPWTKWVWGDVGVSLRIGERFTEYVSLMVARGVFHA
jgi:hypothetical protein